MVKQILMPSLSPTMVEGNIVKWLVKEGDVVSIGDVIAEIETDKSVLELESVENGCIGKIILDAGSENIKVNSVIALLLEDEDKQSDLDNYSYSSSDEKLSSTEAVVDDKIRENKEENKSIENIKSDKVKHDSSNAISQNRLKISPVARKIARENDVELDSVKGSGPDDRIIKKDILNAIAKSGDSSSDLSNNCDLRSSANNDSDAFKKIFRMSNMRKSIARRLTESKRQVPHFYVDVEAQMCNLIKLRKKINECSGFKITINDFIIKAIANALVKYPELNSYLDQDNQIFRNSINISVAISIDNGLVVPVIRDVDKKSIKMVSEETKILINKAKEMKLKPEDSMDGSITISNMGMFGVRAFSAIINLPQSGILAVGASLKKPCVIEDEIKIVHSCILTFSVDHRIIDGVLAAKFLMDVKELIENPLILLV